jgi:hypothetical protein
MDLKELGKQVSEDVKALNPDLFAPSASQNASQTTQNPSDPPKRKKQCTKSKQAQSTPTGPEKRNEEQEQIYLFQLIADEYLRKYPDLGLLHAIPNGGYRAKRTAARMKAAGLKAGVSDLFLPVARGSFHGLYIELKVGKNKCTPLQQTWIDDMRKQGYKAEVHYGAMAALGELLEYLRLPPTRVHT